MRKDELNDFYELIVISLEGAATDEQYAALMEKVKQDDKAALCYAELLSIYANLSCPSLAEPVLEKQHGPSSAPGQVPCSDVEDIWKALLDMERAAPDVKPERPEDPEPERQEAGPTLPRRVNRFWMYTALVSSAALILLVLSAHMARWILPQEVATFTSNFKAQWDLEGDATVGLGQRLQTKTTLRIQKGLAELTFDEGAKVIVEAPAAFELLGRNRMRLHTGRLSALIPEEAHGFTVDTAFSRVTDLGTEFGIEASKRGDAVVQMYEGKARLSLRSSASKHVLINKGQAREVSASDGAITEIPFEPKAFVTSGQFVVLRDGTDDQANASMAVHPALVVHLDASRAATVDVDADGAVQSWGNVTEASVPHGATPEAGMARYAQNALGPGLGAIDFGDPTLEKKSAPTQMRLLSETESQVFLDQTREQASGFTVALVVRVQTHGSQTWSNIVGNTSVVDVPGFFVRWNILNGRPKAVAFLGGQSLQQECAFFGNTVVLVCCYDRKTETFSLWDSYSNQTSRKTVKAGDYTMWNEAGLSSASDHTLYLGAFGRNRDRYFDGLIGEVRIYNQALDMIELMSLKDELVRKWEVTASDL
jgi:ferric-dicitrate binding protein FerR (iron transport regulator)